VQTRAVDAGCVFKLVGVGVLGVSGQVRVRPPTYLLEPSKRLGTQSETEKPTDGCNMLLHTHFTPDPNHHPRPPTEPSNPHNLPTQQFGAYYGLAASLVISSRQSDYTSANPKNSASYISNIFSMIGGWRCVAGLTWGWGGVEVGLGWVGVVSFCVLRAERVLLE